MLDRLEKWAAVDRRLLRSGERISPDPFAGRSGVFGRQVSPHAEITELNVPSFATHIGNLVILAGSVLSAALALLAISGWVTPVHDLASFSDRFIPMSPTTACALFVAAVSLLLCSGGLLSSRPWATKLEKLLFGLVTLLSLVELSEFLFALPSSVVQPQRFAAVAAGRVSPLTAVGLLFVGLSRLLRSRRPTMSDLAGLLTVVPTAIGGVVLLGYLYGTPLLYGGSVIPVALTTGIAFMVLGGALIAGSGSEYLPLRPLLGPSARARMLRAFLPPLPAAILFDALLIGIFPIPNPALRVAVFGLLMIVVVSLGVFSSAHNLGKTMDRAFTALSERERQLRAIFAGTRDAVLIADNDGNYLDANPAACYLLGMAREDVLRIGFHSLCEPAAESLELWERCIRLRHGSGEYTLVLTDRTRRLVEFTVTANILPGRHLVVFHDITAHREAEKALHESEQKLRAFFDSKAVGILFGDVDGAVIDANDAFLDMVGYSRLELESHLVRWTDITPAEFLPLDERAIREARLRGACRPYEKQHLRKDGSRLWVLVGFVLLEPERRQSVAFVLDIDEKRRTEQALQQSEERFARLFQSSPVAVAMVEQPGGHIIDVNEQCCELFRYRRSEMVGKSALELGLWVDSSERAELTEQLRSGKQIATLEARLRRSSGEILYGLVSMTESVLPPLPEKITIVTVVDITVRKELESQLVQSQKMEAVGRLAGGIAHDFNNMLGAILGFTELLRNEVDQTQAVKLEQIVKTARRGANLTTQLLAFSRRQVLEPKIVNLNDLVEGTAEMLRRLIGEDVRLETMLDPALGCIKADPGQIEQVIMNLSVNARDAMHDGGILRITTENAELDENVRSRHGPVVAGHYVVLTVSDSGSGMDDETKSHLFEPFFTTKERGKGTGLGLSTVYGIIRQSAGHIWVYSEKGRGTTVKIYLPRVNAVADGPEEKPRPTDASGTESILLAEDEPSLRELIDAVLTGNGYRVVSAEDGRTALETASRNRGEYSLLITDVVMPGMNGQELAETLMTRYRDLKVLFISGYAADATSPENIISSRAAFLAKPFTNDALLEHVRRILDAPPSNS